MENAVFTAYIVYLSLIIKSLGTLSFAKDANGKWGYKVAGADPVIPFKKDLELLWTNPYPTDSFGAQTITLSKQISNYKYLVFACYGGSTNTHTIIENTFRLSTETSQFRVYSTIRSRLVSINQANNTVTFSVGYNNDLSVDNALCVPAYVYGIG